MREPINVLMVGKWNVGYSHETGHILLFFEFPDKPPQRYAIAKEEAEQIAKAILSAQQDASMIRKPN